jgi:hypothetical protein
MNIGNRVFFISLIGVLIAGCSKSEFRTAPTTGIVLCEGKPVAGAFVYFEPVEDGGTAMVGKAAFCRTDADGKFVLTTYTSNDGAVIGKHRVRVGGVVKGCNCRLSDNIDLKQVEIVAGKNEFTLELPKATAAERRMNDSNASEDDD